jgi:hypothetical protein
LQEEVDNRAIALTVKASKLTAKTLSIVLAAAVRKIKTVHNKSQTPHGRQSVRKLMNHGEATNAIPLNGDTRLFDRVARKWNVDYSFHKIGHTKYLLLFKSGQADAITAAFSDYTKLYMKRARDNRPPIHEQYKKHEERARSKPREHER